MEDIGKLQLDRSDTDIDSVVENTNIADMSEGNNSGSNSNSGLSVIRNVAVSELTKEQKLLLSGIYTKIAEALPTEGRDYELEIKFDVIDGKNAITFRLVGLTPIGEAFSRHIGLFFNVI
jgi:hypothetical protein